MADELLTGRCVGSYITAVLMLGEATFRDGMRNKCRSAGLYTNAVVLPDSVRQWRNWGGGGGGGGARGEPRSAPPGAPLIHNFWGK